MAPAGPETGDFVDHYEVLACSPDTPFAELKRAYHDKLREFHPDKRPFSSSGTGVRVTQALLDAWEVFQDPAKKEAYDHRWRLQREAALPAHQRAEARRHEGNELYKEAQAVMRLAGPENLSAAATALKHYQAAVARYTEALLLAPEDHRIRSNRALCYAALKDWFRCKQDAQAVTQLNPNFMKGWFLLAKAIWKEGYPLEAQRELDTGLSLLPGNTELLALQAELAPDVEACRPGGGSRLPRVPAGRGCASRNVSPACTPTLGNSRAATPPHSSRSHRRDGVGRTPSKSPAPCASRRDDSVDFHEKTPHFGVDPFADRTARFGHSVHSHGPRLPGQARSVSPTPAAERSHGTHSTHCTHGACGRGPTEGLVGNLWPNGGTPNGGTPCPPLFAQGPFSARPDVGRPMTPSRASPRPPAPHDGHGNQRSRIGSLQGMVAASRCLAGRMGARMPN